MSHKDKMRGGQAKDLRLQYQQADKKREALYAKRETMKFESDEYNILSFEINKLTFKMGIIRKKLHNIGFCRNALGKEIPQNSYSINTF